jgi:3-carboxy-cis,cis-muconate cycloisomerase
MPFSPTDSHLYAALFRDEELAAHFTDERFLHYLLAVEGALATTQGKLGIIPAVAATAIAEQATSVPLDLARLQAATEKAGLPIIELVHQLRAHVGADAGPYVHWGATTQDIMDTALVLQMRAALALIEAKLQTVIAQLAQLAEQHRHTLMAGRTHSQQALPITFGLKVAGWLAPLLRHRDRLAELKPRLLVVQFGGAAGTLASLGDRGLAVVDGLAAELALQVPALPWHTQRDNLVEVANWLTLVSGSLAKMAQDIILLAQSEVGEVCESADPTRGGSSTMPQKSNPIVSELIIAAARTNAGLLSSLHQAMIQEHERATHGWQLEWLTLPQIFALTTAGLNKAIFLSTNLAIDVGRMAENVTASRGMMLAEAVSFALAEKMDRSAAKQLVADAVQIALRDDRHLVDVVQSRCALALDWESLKDEEQYLGVTQQLIDRTLALLPPKPVTE